MGYFPNTVSYNRFVELQQKAVLPMAVLRTSYIVQVFLKMCCLGKCTGISFIDSTSIQACHTCTAYKVRGIKRERSHKTFKGLATNGKTSIGWFFGFKLHIVINDKGEILVLRTKYEVWEWIADNYPLAVSILDFYHALEYLYEFDEKAFPGDTVGKDNWCDLQKGLLLASEVETVIDNIGKINSTFSTFGFI